jgi:hypothetical protein
MINSRKLVNLAVMFTLAAGAASARADQDDSTLAVVMTNDSAANQILVIDAHTGTLLQTLSTNGKGGVAGNARGVKQLGGDLVAVVNYGSNTVSLFKRNGKRLRLDQTVATSSAPVSIDFGNHHMYVAGATTVDSFAMYNNNIWKDGTAPLQLVGGAVPPAGSTAQVGVVDENTLLVTLKTDPVPGSVDVVALHNGTVTGTTPTVASVPAGSLTPFGFSVYPDGTAIISLAHSNQDGLFRHGSFTDVVSSGTGANAPCWTTRVGKYVFTANAASGTISRVVGTGNNIFIDSGVAATLAGGPTDLDAHNGVMGAIDKEAGVSHLSLLSYNNFGELTLTANINLGVSAANGVAILGGEGLDD